ncbi:N-acetylmuramoyl-L-alanine amidase [Leisingera daeponensis]|uniref:N-acetylmuramoyl-L-alanine amidase n=1 Tax=Leisingera daeponensis TaxID=405746 RepID=UPI001C98AD69|nr:N-acetylmuramoyl-L-alanine amidase [Leisingera daeponensis]MBY6055370.1 N-acetylmuramoyl-L-alanine amidase [Leisingera daeponensis]
MKLAIVVGHNARAQGAVRPDTGETEFRWNSHLAQLIEEEARLFPLITVETFFRTPAGGYRAEIERVYRAADGWGADATCELHFNSHGSSSATGTEVLSSGSDSSLRFARALQGRMLVALNLKDRGVKVRRTGRGSESLISGRAPAVLIEPFFGSSPKGQKATDEPHEKRAIARAVLLAAQDAFL